MINVPRTIFDLVLYMYSVRFLNKKYIIHFHFIFSLKNNSQIFNNKDIVEAISIFKTNYTFFYQGPTENHWNTTFISVYIFQKRMCVIYRALTERFMERLQDTRFLS